jgi:signal transduction histidine kinase
MRQFLNWKTYLILVALCIVAASLLYTNQLARRLAHEETKNVEQLAQGIKAIITSSNNQEVDFASTVISQNRTIPLIITDEQGQVIDYKNLDTARAARDPEYIQKRLEAFRQLQPPIISDYGEGRNYIYYGQSHLLTQLRYFPYVQLTIIFVFLLVVLIALSSAHRSIQNQVWIGLSKETAHQLGTPLTSIEAWLELLRADDANAEAVREMQKDVDRLKLVADRFGKVGGMPQLEEEDLLVRLREMVAYMQKRAPSKVMIRLSTKETEIPVLLSGPLFDWVIENLIRNALDAMAGEGSIDISVRDLQRQIIIDIRDTGKGMPRHQIKKVFRPGFTTKKRGWGLGLSLSRRIIEKYHHGSLFVKQSELGKGTTFRIILRR